MNVDVHIAPKPIEDVRHDWQHQSRAQQRGLAEQQ